MMESLASQSLSDPRPLPQYRWGAATTSLNSLKEPGIWVLESSGKPVSMPVLSLLEQCQSLNSLSQFLNLPSGDNYAGIYCRLCPETVCSLEVWQCGQTPELGSYEVLVLFFPSHPCSSTDEEGEKILGLCSSAHVLLIQGVPLPLGNRLCFWR